MIDYLWQDYHGMTVESVLINCHYPVTPTSFMLQWGVIVKRPPGLSDEQAARFGAKFAKFVGIGFEQDVQIWMNKSRVDNPLLCAEDGPVYQLRRWYEQFYRDAADIDPQMTARYEFEIDTTRPVAGWETEVAANLAARRTAAESLAASPAEAPAGSPAETGGGRMSERAQDSARLPRGGAGRRRRAGRDLVGGVQRHGPLAAVGARRPAARRAHRRGNRRALLVPPGSVRRVRLPAGVGRGRDGAQRGT
jgi:hypothetical protein